MVFEATGRDATRSLEALDRLVRRYWPAVYAFFRSSGQQVEEASDLTQSFVCDVMLKRSLLRGADPSRGRFRALLLTALRNYLCEHHRSATRVRASHRGMPPLKLDPIELEHTEVSPQLTPEAAFCARWSATLVRHVLEEVRAHCLKDGLEVHWAVFEARVVRPMLLGQPPAGYAELIQRLDLPDVSQASNMMITVKRRFARALYAEVGRTVSDPSKVDEELAELLRDLERPS
jgi:RNA polymerase sigma-70 factor (ECF subfamily)